MLTLLRCDGFSVSTLLPKQGTDRGSDDRLVEEAEPHPSPLGGGSGTGSLLLHYFSTNRVDSRGLRWRPVDSTVADKRLTSNVLDHKLRVVSQLPKHARMGSTPAASKVACDSAPAAEQARTPEDVQERPARRFGSLVPLSARHAYASLADARSSFGDNGSRDDGAPQR